MSTDQTPTRVFVVTPQGQREYGTIVEPEHVEIYTTSRASAESLRVVTIQWDDGDITDERGGDFRIA